MERFILGIDIGTSAVKAALFRTDGTTAASDSQAYQTEYPYPGWVQQDPRDWWDAVCACVKRLILRTGTDPAAIVSVGVDGQSWAMVALDAGGAVVCPSPIWTDCRAAEVCLDMKEKAGEERLFRCSGNPVMPGYTTPKLLWLKKERPDEYVRVRTVLQSNGYIVFQLTGRMTQDICQAYGWHCFDMRAGHWDEALAEKLGIDPALLPPIVGCSDVVGCVTREAAEVTGLAKGTPVVAGGLDAACGTLGVGVIHPGQTQEQGGQAGGMSICLDTCKAHPNLILSRHVVPGRWLLQGGTTGGGGALRWFREQFCPELSFENMNVEAERAGDADDLFFLPYMAGERSPVWEPKAEGVFWGLSFSVTRGQMIRAVMEGVAFSLRHNLEAAAQCGCTVGRLRTTGGSGKSRLWTQIKADVTGYGIDAVMADMETAKGAALLGGMGIGLFRDWDAAVGTTSVRMRCEPDWERNRFYSDRYARYLKLVEAALPVMKERS